MLTVPVTGRFDLTDGQWAVLEPLLPRGKKPGRPVTWTKRQLINGIRWRVRTGSPWRDVPDRYGPWESVYGLFRRWQRAGVWARSPAPPAACPHPSPHPFASACPVLGMTGAGATTHHKGRRPGWSKDRSGDRTRRGAVGSTRWRTPMAGTITVARRAFSRAPGSPRSRTWYEPLDHADRSAFGRRAVRGRSAGP